MSKTAANPSTNPSNANPSKPPTASAPPPGDRRPAAGVSDERTRAEEQRKADAQNLQKQARVAQEEVQEQVGEAVETVKRETFAAAQRAKQAGQDYVASKQTLLANEVSVFSAAIHKASEKLQEEEHSSLASYLDAAAEQLQRLENALQQKSPQQLLGDAEGFARRHPEWVYGGLFVAGLLGVRFLKAGRPSARQSHTRVPQASPSVVPPSPGASQPSQVHPHAPHSSPIHRSPDLPVPATSIVSQTGLSGGTR